MNAFALFSVLMYSCSFIRYNCYWHVVYSSSIAKSVLTYRPAYDSGSYVAALKSRI